MTVMAVDRVSLSVPTIIAGFSLQAEGRFRCERTIKRDRSFGSEIPVATSVWGRRDLSVSVFADMGP